MSELPSPLILAADGGGTRCRLVLCAEDKRHAVEVGAANVSSDFEGAVAELRRGLALLAEAAGVEDLAEVPAYLGLAGVIDPEIAARVAGALPLDYVRVEEDRLAALQGALGAEDGVVAHCGTGSFFGARLDGKVRFSGGWGWKLGDEASGYWLGRMALRQALAAQDGLQRRSAMVDSLLQRFQGASGIVAWAAEARVDEIADLSAEVSRNADKGDPVAVEVMQAGAGVVAREVSALGWQAGIPLCLTGGVARTYAPYLPEEMRAAVRPSKGQPIDGAVELAWAFAREVGA